MYVGAQSGLKRCFQETLALFKNHPLAHAYSWPHLITIHPWRLVPGAAGRGEVQQRCVDPDASRLGPVRGGVHHIESRPHEYMRISEKQHAASYCNSFLPKKPFWLFRFLFFCCFFSPPCFFLAGLEWAVLGWLSKKKKIKI